MVVLLLILLLFSAVVKLDLSFKPDKIVATSNGSTLNAQILFSANASSGLVDRASLTCDAKINFKVSVPNHPIWQVVADIVVDVYGKRINTLICSELKTLVDTDLTSLLQGINSSIEPFLDGHHPPPVYPDYGHEALNFTGSALMGLVDFLIGDATEQLLFWRGLSVLKLVQTSFNQRKPRPSQCAAP